MIRPFARLSAAIDRRIREAAAVEMDRRIAKLNAEAIELAKHVHPDGIEGLRAESTKHVYVTTPMSSAHRSAREIARQMTPYSSRRPR